MLTIESAMSDPLVFGPVLGDPSTWVTWRTIVKSMMAEPLTGEERAIFDVIAGGREPPRERVSEVYIRKGRRGGGSRMGGMLAAYAAGFLAPSVPVSPGEEALVVSVAPTTRQASKVIRYAKGFIAESPVLSASVVSETANEVRLEGDVVLTTRAADTDTIRGDTIVMAIFDELAFWSGEDSANPDREIYTAIAPSLLTTNGLIVGISSPYAKRGLLYEKCSRHFGKNDPRVLVIQAETWTLNPMIPRDHPLVVARFEEDPVAAAAEHGMGWREDVEDFLSRDAVDRCVDVGVTERPPEPGVRYVAFVDPSGGSRDSMTLCIGHEEAGVVVVDAIRETVPPFSPEACVEAFAETLALYGVTRVTGDRYGGEWPRERFSKAGITYEIAEKSKSGLYSDTLAAVNGKRVRLLDNRRLVNQLCALERRTSRGAGRDTIDHPPGGRDDVANAVAGLVSKLTGKAKPRTTWYIDGATIDSDGNRVEREEPAEAPASDFDPWRDLGPQWRGENAFKRGLS